MNQKWALCRLCSSAQATGGASQSWPQKYKCSMFAYLQRTQSTKSAVNILSNKIVQKSALNSAVADMLYTQSTVNKKSLRYMILELWMRMSWQPYLVWHHPCILLVVLVVHMLGTENGQTLVSYSATSSNLRFSQQVYSLSKANEVHMFGIDVGKLDVNKQEDLETRLH